MRTFVPTILLVATLLNGCTPIQPAGAGDVAGPITLRLAVSLTPQELASFQAAVVAVDATHPEWEVVLEAIPQQSVMEKINTQLAANDLADVVRVQGLQVQQWIRQGAFLNLSPSIEQAQLDLADFYPGPLDQFRWQAGLWGLPDSAAPEVLFYNKTMFDAAGLDYPTATWGHEEMRSAALQLTVDAQGRNATDPAFNPDAMVQWGWNGGLTYFWQRHLVRGWGGDFCGNDDCTLMNFTQPATLTALAWWVELVHTDRAALYDPYGGSQTGVPGDPFLAGKAAMGYNGFFAVGQLNSMGSIDYDVVEPLLGADGQRYTPLSTNGYVVAANSQYPEAAWSLVQALLQPEFLENTWGKPGHAVPARRSAANSVINLAHAPANQAAIVAAMEYGEVFKPYTSAAFEVYGKTVELFTQMNKGELAVAEGAAQIEQIANEVLARDRQ
jgi:multiple sugar transport system substrate-binding protein